jgi:2'-5' RNA ligase
MSHTGICIVWPCWFEGSTDPESHVTALFLGTTDTVDYSKEDVERVLGSYLWPAWVKVTGTDLFGRNKDVPVLKLEHSTLLDRSRIDILTRLNRVGIHASTEFGFNPHVTIAKEAEHIQAELFRPREVHLEAPALWWGSTRTLHTVHTMYTLKQVAA